MTTPRSALLTLLTLLALLLSFVSPPRPPNGALGDADAADAPSPGTPGALGNSALQTPPDTATRARVKALLNQLPLYFVENQGQADEQVDFYIKGHDKTIYFTPQGLTFVLTEHRPADDEPRSPFARSPLGPRHLPPATRWVIKLDFVDANLDVHPVGEEKADAVVSYFKGSPDQWHTGIPTYRRIVYKDLWPGIDLAFTGTVNELKYEFIVRPGADPGRIRLAYRGAEVAQAADGQLEVATPIGGFTDAPPVAYQEIEGRRVPVSVAYDLASPVADPQPATRHVQFAVGPYDPTRPLVLDPAILIYCGYIGGADNDHGSDIAVDGAGNAYVVGWTSSSESEGFPVAGGPDPTYNGDGDAFVAKVRADGTGLTYCGYIGGADWDQGSGIAVDEAGNTYVVGWTTSSEDEGFPVTTGPDLTYNGDGTFGGDTFVAKVDANGTRLDYCGYIGGSDDDWGYGVAVDQAGSAYIAGRTWSSASEGFPVVVGPDLTYNGDGIYGGGDAFVAKVRADGTGLDYCGYIGGSDGDAGRDIAVDGGGNAYVVGDTGSSKNAGFPVTVGPDLTYNGDWDVFVAKVQADGMGLIYCGYIGGSDPEWGYGIAVDKAGNAYVTGGTSSAESEGFPVTVGPDLTYNGGYYGDAFVAKVRADGMGLDYCGYIGGPGNDEGNSVAVDMAGNAYVVGSTTSPESEGFPVTVGPDLTYNGGLDAFIARVRADGTGLDYCGYIGGPGDDRGDGVAVDKAGNAYVVGGTTSPEDEGFPVTIGPDLTYHGKGDAFVAKVSTSARPALISFSLSTASAVPTGQPLTTIVHVRNASTTSQDATLTLLLRQGSTVLSTRTLTLSLAADTAAKWITSFGSRRPGRYRMEAILAVNGTVLASQGRDILITAPNAPRWVLDHADDVEAT